MKKIFINNLLILVIFFTIFEITIRFFNLADLRGHGEELIKKKKNVETISFGEKVYLDKYGYRVPRIKYEYDYDLKKIIFIGDSVLFGSGVKEEKTIVGNLRKEFDNLTFINSARIGNNIEDIFLDIKENIMLFKSQNFFVFLSLDDISLKSKQPKRIDEKKTLITILQNNYILKEINIFLRNKSYTYLYIKGLITNPSKRYFLENYNYYKNESMINFFNKNIEKIKIIKQQDKINVNFIILPYQYQVKEKCKKNYLLPQKIIKNILSNNNFKLIDMTKKFCDDPEFKDLYLNFDPVHLSEKGHNLVFQELKNKINHK